MVIKMYSSKKISGKYKIIVKGTNVTVEWLEEDYVDGRHVLNIRYYSRNFDLVKEAEEFYKSITLLDKLKEAMKTMKDMGTRPF
jgi:hypothetical protein